MRAGDVLCHNVPAEDVPSKNVPSADVLCTGDDLCAGDDLRAGNMLPQDVLPQAVPDLPSPAVPDLLREHLLPADVRAGSRRSSGRGAGTRGSP